MPLSLRTYDSPNCRFSILLILKRQYKFKKCGRLDCGCLWMSNRRRPQLKREVNINLSRYVTLCLSFIEQLSEEYVGFNFLGFAEKIFLRSRGNR